MSKTKTRLRISLDEGQAERIRAHAAWAGMDISSYLLSAVVHQMNAQDQSEGRAADADTTELPTCARAPEAVA
jgi:uncharacterized protein (DUF1778 family)